jgi:hypothetical protein
MNKHLFALWLRVGALAVLAICAVLALEILGLVAFILYKADPSSSRDFVVSLLMTGVVRCGVGAVLAAGAWVWIESVIAAFAAPAERGAP